jgi:hypothetical protein
VQRDFQRAATLATYEEARNVLRQAVEREAARIRTLLPLADGEPALRTQVEAEAAGLEAARSEDETRLAAYFTDARVPAPSAGESRLARVVPAPVATLDSGLEKLYGFHDPSLSREAGFYVRHLVDGRRSVVDVWNTLRAIFPGTTLAATETYLDKMDEAGLVKMPR